MLPCPRNLLRPISETTRPVFVASSQFHDSSRQPKKRKYLKMKRRKEVDLELKEIRQDVQLLKTKLETLCEWITKKFDVVFEQDPITLTSQFCLQTQPLSFSIEDKSLKSKPDKPHEHSYCISSTSTSNPNPNLYDMVEDDEIMENNPATPTGNFSISPPCNGNPSILNTPKKSAGPLSKSSPPSKNKPISSRESSSVLEPVNNPFNAVRPQSPPQNSNADLENATVQQLPSHGQTPKKKRIRPKRVRAPKSQPTTATLDQVPNDEIEKAKNPKSQIIQCEICGKLINGSTAMKRHCQTHNNYRPHSCSECGKSFQRKFHLKTHMLTHNGEKKHQCRFCGKLFLLPKDIIAHERVHTGEKPYPCAHCSRRFTLKSHLVMHTRTHTGEKPYKCDSCEKCFTQANSLRVHKKVHLPPPPPGIPSEPEIVENAPSPIPAEVSMQNPVAEEYSVSSSGFNVIGQLIPISLSSSIINQIPCSTATCTTFRIPIQLPVLQSGSRKCNDVTEPGDDSGSELVNHSLPEDVCYYDLETL